MNRLLITFFGLGRLPVAPGTWGSAGAAGVWLGLWWIAGAAAAQPVVLHGITLGLALLISAATVVLGPWTVREFGRPDPGPCVADEAAGQWLALLAMPMGSVSDVLTVCAGQFLLFRVFDIIKPPPARRLEKLPHGWGILLDDVAAGLYANLIGQIVFRWLWPVGG